MIGLRGSELGESDYAALSARWIDPETARRGLLRRANSLEGAEIVGRNGSGRYEGLLIPYIQPGADRVREFRLRRDHPEYENGKPRQKYMSPPGRGNMLYFAPGTDPALLSTTNVPVVLTEGEFKALALARLAAHAQDGKSHARFLPVGLPGVWNWRGTTGKTTDAAGARVDEKGPIPDLGLIEWKNRAVLIVFDRDSESNDSVRAARYMLSQELTKRGARVRWFAWPDSAKQAKGIDDLLAVLGPDEVLRLLAANAKPAKSEQRTTAPSRQVISPKLTCMEDLMADETMSVGELLVEGLLPKRGLVLIGGRPKDGKSWFACQLALSVVTGEPLGGWLKVPAPGRTHLWALEDRHELTRDKVLKLLGGRHPDGIRDLQVIQELERPVLQGGDELIRAALRESPAEMIILDSLFKLTGASQQNYDISQRDYDVIDRVRKIAVEHNCVAAIIMHTKKGSRGGNPVENILGTSGTSAAADVIAELKRTGLKEGKLTVVGRLIAQETYEMIWHPGPDEWGWTIEDDGDDVALGETSQEVLVYLDAQGPTKPAVVAAALHKSFGGVWQALLRLQEKGKVTRGRDKKWEIAR